LPAFVARAEKTFVAVLISVVNKTETIVFPTRGIIMYSADDDELQQPCNIAISPASWKIFLFQVEDISVDDDDLPAGLPLLGSCDALVQVVVTQP